jgi:CheY-specific phosphatase CheX
MFEKHWEQMLSTAAEQVLETMFFTAVYGPAPEGEPADTPRFAARLGFEGTPSGALTIGISQPAAHTLAGNFLAVEEEEGLTDAQVGGVVCELANMICGALLSRVEGEEHFRLSSPELVPDTSPAACQHRRSLDLGDGTLDLWLAVENHAA